MYIMFLKLVNNISNFNDWKIIVKKVSEFFRKKNIPLSNITLGLYNNKIRIDDNYGCLYYSTDVYE